MASSPSDTGYRDRNTTTDRTLTILGMFSDTVPTISAAQIATTLGVARSTAYRYVETLVVNGFLEESPHGFRLGIRILELARVARRAYGLSDVALPHLKALAERFHQTVLLTRRTGTSVICVEREEAEQQYVRFSYERGSRLPINAGASALVLLAWLPDDDVRELLSKIDLPSFTSATVTAVDDLVSRLQDIRETGYSLTLAEVDADALGIAAPIFAPDGSVAAAVSIIAMQSRLPPSERAAATAAVCDAAEGITRTLAQADLT